MKNPHLKVSGFDLSQKLIRLKASGGSGQRYGCKSGCWSVHVCARVIVLRLYFCRRGMTMNSEERERYARHLNLAQIGEQGQRLRAGSVRCRCGFGLACALYLASAGVGTIGIVDADVVELSNLQRQVLHFTADIGQLKNYYEAERVEPRCQAGRLFRTVIRFQCFANHQGL